MKSIPLQAIADEQLDNARHSRDGRGAHTVHGGHRHGLRQTVVALAKGRRFRQDADLAEATLQVLRGRVGLTTLRDRWEGVTGDQVIVPPQQQCLDVLQDSVILLTVHTDHPHTTVSPAVAADGSKVPA
jgi:quercetin dioxygenase-like cupin family protein